MVRTVCLCKKKHSPLIVWAIVWLSIPRYTWRHPTISHTLSGFGRESPAGHPKKNRFVAGTFMCRVSAVLNPDYFANCFAMCENLSCFSETSHLEFYFQKRLHTFKCCQSLLSHKCATILHSVVCCQPILCSTSRPCTVVWWQILTLRIFFTNIY